MEEVPDVQAHVHMHRHAALLGVQRWEPEISWFHGVESQTMRYTPG